MPRKDQDSLDRDVTRTGGDDPRYDKSLGEQPTAGDATSSVSDLDDHDEDQVDGMEVVDLSSRFDIERTLGEGGMGEVVLATDKRLKRQVAIKRIKSELVGSKKAMQRFLTEAQSVAALNHFNIVQVYDYGRDEQGPFLILEYVDGPSLQEKLKDGPLEVDEAINIACQLCEGLSVSS